MVSGKSAPGCMAIFVTWHILTGQHGSNLAVDGTGGDCRRRSKFPEHWGFDVASIEQALAHKNAMKTVFAVRRRFLSRQPKTLFMGWAQLGSKRAGSRINAGIETVWSKKRILTVYLNIADLATVCLASKLRHNVISTNPQQTYPLGSCITGCCIT